MDPELRRELDRLTARLDAIERHLLLRPATPDKDEEPDLPAEPDHAFISADAPAEPISRPPTPPGVAAPNSLDAPPPIPPGAPSPGALPPLGPPTVDPAPQFDPLRLKAQRLQRLRALDPSGASAPGPPAGVRQSLEQLIAERWMAWLGAIVVVLAAGFFVKLAYDQGWMRLPPSVKCLIAAGFGILLIAAGEWALRTINRVAAVSLFAAGLGTLYMTAFATFRFFDLLSQSSAFALMFFVALLGVAITIRGRMLTIGVLSLIGGYLTPILLSGAATFAAALPLYATALLLVGLALSAFVPDPFRPLRYVAVVLHAQVVTLWLGQEGADHWLIAVSFLTIAWAFVTVEVLWAALRGQSARGNAVLSLLTTIWYSAGGCGVLAAAQPGQGDWLGLFTLVVAVVCAAIALPFGPGLSVLSRHPKHAMHMLTLTLWAQVGVLLAAAIGLQFRGPGESFGQTIGWLAMGAVCVELGRRLRSRGVGIFGLVVGALALLRVWIVDPRLAILRVTIWSAPDVTITRWFPLALAAVAVCIFAAHRVVPIIARRGLPVALTTLAVLQWLALCVSQSDGLVTTLGWLLAAIAFLTAAPIGRVQRYPLAARVVLWLCTARWLLVDAIAERLAPSWDPQALSVLVNAQMALGAAIAIVFGLLAWWNERSTAGSPGSDWGERATRPVGARVILSPLTAGILLLLVALSFEVDRWCAQTERMPDAYPWVWPPAQLRALLWVILWGAGGLATHLAGRMLRLLTPTVLGVALLVLSATVWLSFGTLLWRVDQGVAPAAVFLNLQFLAGALLGGMLALAAWASRWGDRDEAAQPIAGFDDAWPVVSWTALTAIGLWAGSLEIDRFFGGDFGERFDSDMARQTSLSIYWGLFAIGTVAVGFWRRVAAVRYAGLGLLAITAAKVLLIDLGQVRAVYRVLSLLATGLLLIGTSIAYSKLASRLASDPDADADLAAEFESNLDADTT